MTPDHSTKKASAKAAPSGRGNRRRGRQVSLRAVLEQLQRDVREVQKANATLQRIAEGMLATLAPREREVLRLRFNAKVKP